MYPMDESERHITALTYRSDCVELHHRGGSQESGDPGTLEVVYGLPKRRLRDFGSRGGRYARRQDPLSKRDEGVRSGPYRPSSPMEETPVRDVARHHPSSREPDL